MERWLRITDNGGGEWSVVDIRRNYRLCSFNDAYHGGTHLHEGKRVERVPIASLDDAKRIVRRYARSHERFDMDAFKEVMRRWNSEPSID